jgi:hypothetical protein
MTNQRVNLNLPKISSQYGSNQVLLVDMPDGPNDSCGCVLPLGKKEVLIMYMSSWGRSYFENGILRMYARSPLLINDTMADGVASCIRKINGPKSGHLTKASSAEIFTPARRLGMHGGRWWSPQHLRTYIDCAALLLNTDPDDLLFLERPGRLEDIGIYR